MVLVKAIVLLSPLLFQANALEAPIEGYGVEELEWEVEVFPNDFQSFNGTVQQVHKQVHQLNPRWLAERSPEKTSGSTRDRRVILTEEEEWKEIWKTYHRFELDTGIKWKNLVCAPGPNNWEPVSAQYANDHIFEDLEHLYGLGREMDLVSKAKTGRVPGNGPGPGNCGRVACTFNTAIWWCNDNKEAYQLRSWLDIVQGAVRVIKGCRVRTVDEYGQKYFKSGGQQFAMDNWNVVVRRDETDC
ncbi:hypothetical protein C2857_004778 [Epichloe festucae Fl1]|uniref:Uncharacterized protein n=1 Tax=Epichloe festucae (strain Fl1) TaxID=877507 RepID=A0A7S9KSG5_EPIFF|nr:hypothetical protein C2857_004778 [Epichloe festucae Fl1]